MSHGRQKTISELRGNAALTNGRVYLVMGFWEFKVSDWRIVCAWLVAAAVGVSIYFLPVMRLLDAIAE
jgi:hypothetical protein